MEEHLAIFQRIVNNDVQAYELLFRAYYKFLCAYAHGLVRDKDAAEEIVENFFVELWNNRHRIKITTSVRSYFVGSVHNRSLNYLQREKPRYISTQDISSLIDREGSSGDRLISFEVPTLLTRELEQTLAKAIEDLPKQCKEVFILSRFRNLPYEDIASRMNISVNTVKTQIKIALRKLKESLRDYLVLLFIFFIK